MDADDELEAGRAVIRAEAAALQALAGSLQRDSFTKAVDALLHSSGHCIVMGVGKSGHIGRKIAATLASTGTPAFFVHPAEASHGDLGMLTPGCTVLAISSSGESRELGDVLRYCASNALTVIAITGRAQSTLAKAASVLLLLPDVPEACPNGLTPTSSTTMALALGDALALTLMQRRGFSARDFGARHPGGRLGLQLQHVGDWMRDHDAPPPALAVNAPAREVLSVITEGRMGCAAVLNGDGSLAGIITDGDLRRALSDDFFDKTAADMMTANPWCVSRQDRISDVIAQLTARRIANVFVVEDGKPVAALHLKDLLEEGYL